MNNKENQSELGVEERFPCPICEFEGHDPPNNYNICPQCGTEFGNDDELTSWSDLRARWIKGGRRFWWYEKLYSELNSKLPSPPVEPRWCGGEFVESSDGSCANCDAPRERHTTAAERTQDGPKHGGAKLFFSHLLARGCSQCAQGKSILINSAGFYSHGENGNHCNNHKLYKAWEDWTPLPEAAAGSEEPKDFGHESGLPPHLRFAEQSRLAAEAQLAAPVASQAPAPETCVDCGTEFSSPDGNYHCDTCGILILQKKVSALEGRIRELESERDNLKTQAQTWAQEADTQKATVLECYAAVGVTGKCDFHGAEPIREYVKKAEATHDHT